MSDQDDIIDRIDALGDAGDHEDGLKLAQSEWGCLSSTRDVFSARLALRLAYLYECTGRHNDALRYVVQFIEFTWAEVGVVPEPEVTWGYSLRSAIEESIRLEVRQKNPEVVDDGVDTALRDVIHPPPVTPSAPSPASANASQGCLTLLLMSAGVIIVGVVTLVFVVYRFF